MTNRNIGINTPFHTLDLQTSTTSRMLKISFNKLACLFEKICPVSCVAFQSRGTQFSQ